MDMGSAGDAESTPHDVTKAGDPPFLEGAPPQRDTATRDNSLLGARVGNLDIECALGHGTFGTVYKARDVKLGRTVAVKFLTDPAATRHLELFEREAKAIAALGKHPSIVQVYEWGERNGTPYIVLEYARESVANLLVEHPQGLALDQALSIAAACAEGLHHAHEAGILHRDVKPSNILIQHNGNAQLADFGLARYDDVSRTSISGNLTGSPPYMSPEQAAGEQVDGRSDVFSLGVTLYEMLSGRRPFEGKNIVVVLDRIRRGDRTPLCKYRPDLPKPLCAIVEKAFAHQPDDRYPSAGAFAAALRASLEQLKRTGFVDLETNKRRARVRQVAVVAAAVVVAVLLVGAWVWQGQNDSQNTAHAALSEAQSFLESRQAPAAEAQYRAVREAYPDLEDAAYGLGYALIHQGRADEAQAVFATLKDQALREEGLSAAAISAGATPDSGAEAETNGPVDSSNYARVLQAKRSLRSGAYEEALAQLAPLFDQEFPFAWQRSEALLALAQAHYHLGHNDEALRLLAVLQKVGGPGQRSIYEAYHRAIVRREDTALREEVRGQATRIRAIMDGDATAPEATEGDTWSSRRLAFFVLPLEGGQSPYAIDTGLADVFPELMARALEDGPRLQAVDRENVAALLQEQELSGQLSDGAGRLALGRFLGARLVITGRFTRVGESERLLLQVSDTETLETHLAPAIPVQAGMLPDSLVEVAAGAIREAIDTHYPLQARVFQESGQAFVDIGAEQGLAAETAFDILPDPALAPLSDVHVVSQPPVGAARSPVQIFGAEVKALPDAAADGWYARARVSPGNT
jgi:tetratricopeptide (TPR) repeat protein